MVVTSTLVQKSTILSGVIRKLNVTFTGYNLSKHQTLSTLSNRFLFLLNKLIFFRNERGKLVTKT